MEGFLREAKEGDFRLAASYLDLRSVAPSSRDADGPELAQKLAFVLERVPTLHIGKLPDVPEGDPAARTPDTVVADTLYAGEEPVPIALQREHFSDGVDRWLVAQNTVRLIPVIDRAYGPRPIGVTLPPSLTRPTFLGNELWQWLGAVLAVLFSYALARAAAAVVVRAGTYFARRVSTHGDAMVQSARRPLRMLLGAPLFRALLEPLQLTTAVNDLASRGAETVTIVGTWWLVSKALRAWTEVLSQRSERESYNGLVGRRVRTQAALLRRVASMTAGFVAVSVFLLQFDRVRNVGVSLLASAGVLGVVVGLAAQKSLSAI
ncbi:MAG TPA: hypothetical protein VKU41_22455, partial [Polyangiaceae bacterium]|nr:hypothetical protein [Polyangiaceae bacterium]